MLVPKFCGDRLLKPIMNRFDNPRLEGNRTINQQGGWAQGGSSNWRGERRPGQDSWKESSRVPDRKPNPTADVKCYRCLETGHHQSGCKNEPVCYKCKDKGHLAADCKTFSKTLKMYGFGIPCQGFYAMNFPEEKVKASKPTGIITIHQGDASVDKVDKELKNLLHDSWDLRVRQLDKQVYLVIFPDLQTLDTFSKLSAFEMPLYGLKSTLEKSNLNPFSSSVLHTIWIRIHNIPGVARDVEAVKEISAVVAEPLVVDELSLIRDEPVRVKVRCRKPSAIQGDIEFFFNGEGAFLRFEVEGKKGAGKGNQGGPPPGPGKPDGAPDNDKDQQPRGDKSRKNNGKFSRIDRLDREMDSSHDGSMEEQEESGIKDDNPNGENRKGAPIAAYHPNFGLVKMQQSVIELSKQSEIATVTNSQYVTARKVSKEDLIPGEIIEGNSSQMIVHGRDGPYLMDRNKWPKLTLSSFFRQR